MAYRDRQLYNAWSSLKQINSGKSDSSYLRRQKILGENIMFPEEKREFSVGYIKGYFRNNFPGLVEENGVAIKVTNSGEIRVDIPTELFERYNLSKELLTQTVKELGQELGKIIKDSIPTVSSAYKEVSF